MASKKILAFDFDGVLCDGLAEYFYSSAIAYQDITKSTLKPETLETIRPAFYELRPVIETGWEMVALIQALLNGETSELIWQDWSGVLQKTLRTWDVDKQTLMTALDNTRDRLITDELAHWLSLHRFYDGAIGYLKQLLASQNSEIYIITTKEGRFAYQLFVQQGIDFPRERIFGKEVKQSKAKTLKQLQSDNHPSTFWFIEDRFKTLQKVRQEPELDNLQLFFATWGYNRAIAPETLLSQRVTAVDLQTWQEKITELIVA